MGAGVADCAQYCPCHSYKAHEYLVLSAVLTHHDPETVADTYIRTLPPPPPRGYRSSQSDPMQMLQPLKRQVCPILPSSSLGVHRFRTTGGVVSVIFSAFTVGLARGVCVHVRSSVCLSVLAFCVCCMLLFSSLRHRTWCTRVWIRSTGEEGPGALWVVGSWQGQEAHTMSSEGPRLAKPM